MKTIREIIERTYSPKEGLSERDLKILKNRLGLLAECYFCENNKQKWAIFALYGSVTNLAFSLKSCLFDVKKRSLLDFDINKECELFLNGKHILCE